MLRNVTAKKEKKLAGPYHDVALRTRTRVSSLGLSRFLSGGFLIKEQIRSTWR